MNDIKIYCHFNILLQLVPLFGSGLFSVCSPNVSHTSSCSVLCGVHCLAQRPSLLLILISSVFSLKVNFPWAKLNWFSRNSDCHHCRSFLVDANINSALCHSVRYYLACFAKSCFECNSGIIVMHDHCKHWSPAGASGCWSVVLKDSLRENCFFCSSGRRLS